MTTESKDCIQSFLEEIQHQNNTLDADDLFEHGEDLKKAASPNDVLDAMRCAIIATRFHGGSAVELRRLGKQYEDSLSMLEASAAGLELVRERQAKRAENGEVIRII